MTRAGNVNDRGRGARKGSAGTEPWKLTLYVMGESRKSLRALNNLRNICDTYLDGRCLLDVVDLEKEPHRAREDQILAVPSLLRRSPPPIRRIIGDLSDTDKVLAGLDLRPGD